jgi:hypothetical protein
MLISIPTTSEHHKEISMNVSNNSALVLSAAIPLPVSPSLEFNSTGPLRVCTNSRWKQPTGLQASGKLCISIPFAKQKQFLELVYAAAKVAA